MASLKSDWVSFVVFGLPTWALVDGTWAALSQLAEHVPEGYNISAYLILCLTFGNIFPLCIGYYLRKAAENFLRITIATILVTGLVTGCLMGGLWNVSVTIGGAGTSLPLYFLFFIVGACSSSSNVTHYTFVSTYDGTNTTALATGMGLGSMIAGILGILQGLVFVQYGFTLTYYYLVLAMLYVPALYFFYHLHQASSQSGDIELLVKSDLSTTSREYNDQQFVKENYPILLLQLINSGLGYGFVPALISFACGKFNNSQLVLLLATAIAAIIDPWFKALTEYYRLSTIESLWRATGCLIALCVGLIICASAPDGSSLYQGAGGVLPASLYICFGALFGFTNTCVFRYYKEKTAADHVQHAYRWSGIASQSGALIGSFIAFSLVVSGSL